MTLDTRVVGCGMSAAEPQRALGATATITSPRAPHILQRETFRTSRLLDFCHEPELVKQIGHLADRWPLVVLRGRPRRFAGTVAP
jgi:hypothetical protein